MTYILMQPSCVGYCIRISAKGRSDVHVRHYVCLADAQSGFVWSWPSGVAWSRVWRRSPACGRYAQAEAQGEVFTFEGLAPDQLIVES
jgi:hypothetical protein